MKIVDPKNILTSKVSQFKDTWNTSVRLVAISWGVGRWLFIGTLLSVLIPAITPFALAYFVKLVIDQVVLGVTSGSVNYNHLFMVIGGAVAMSYLNSISFRLQDFTTKLTYSKLPIKLYDIALSKISTLDMRYFEDSDFRDTLQKVRDNFIGPPQNLLSNIFFLFQSTVQVLIALVAILKLNKFLALLIFVVSVPDIINQLYFSKVSWGIWSHMTPYRKRFWYLFGILQDRDSIKELKIFQTAKKFLDELNSTQVKFYDENKKVLKKQFGVNSLFSLLDTAVNYGVYVYVILEAIARRITVGDISFYQSVIANFNSGLGGAFRNFGNIFEQSLYVKSIFDVLDIEPEIVDSPKSISIDVDSSHEIEFKNVSFRYPGTKRYILRNFSLKLRKGEKAAFVGENGAGKSTIIKLLARLYDVDKGEILIDGINIKDIKIESLHRTLGILFQDFVKYQDSAKDNIYFGRVWDKEDLTKIIDAAKSAGANEMIKQFEKGYEQILGRHFEGGLELSGGQWQKIALSRAFFRNAPVLILDEPTAAIDAKAESEIFNRVEKLSKDKTVIIISHRFSTVRNADKIYVIDGGKIVESGNHQQLMVLDRQYATLFNLQAKGYR